ncbi:NTP transferase domain-containing protein [Candidatus Woesearchaeota archaeon]|nr:NTP transferase domain-containing protein [Candidatus Woesearchaeota archaeon]
MKLVILAAGKGVRMLPLTEHIPKVLVEVNGKPFLHYVLENAQKAGFADIGLVVGYKKEKIEEFLKKNEIKAALMEQKKQLGTGDAVKQAQNFCKNGPFVLLGGDNLFSAENLTVIQKNDEFCYVAGKEVEEYKKYGILITEGEKLIKIIEKPQQFVGNLANVGLYKFTPDIWSALEQIGLSPRGEYELTDAITILAQQGKVKVLKLQKYWMDLGSKEDIPRIEEFLKSGAILY